MRQYLSTASSLSEEEKWVKKLMETVSVWAVLKGVPT